MKKIRILLPIVFVFVFSGLAKSQTSSKESISQRTERYINELKLGDDQATKTRELSSKYEQFVLNAKSLEEKKKYSKKLDSELQLILTDEQYVKYKEIRAKENREKVARVKASSPSN